MCIIYVSVCCTNHSPHCCEIMLIIYNHSALMATNTKFNTCTPQAVSNHKRAIVTHRVKYRWDSHYIISRMNAHQWSAYAFHSCEATSPTSCGGANYVGCSVHGVMYMCDLIGVSMSEPLTMLTVTISQPASIVRIHCACAFTSRLLHAWRIEHNRPWLCLVHLQCL